MSPRVSILLPVHNGIATIVRSVQSCLQQTFRDYELTILNDGSTDGTEGILRKQFTDPRIKIEQNPGRGLVAALNHGIKMSGSPYIARMDADDLMYPQRLEKQVSYLGRYPNLHVCGCLVNIPGDNSPESGPEDQLRGFRRYQHWTNQLTRPSEIASERFVESPLVHPSVMMRRETLDAVGRYRETAWAEDYDLWLRMLEKGFRLGKVPEILMDWYDLPQRLTRTDPRYSPAHFLMARAFYLARLPLIRRNGVMISGAGFIAKHLSRLLTANGITVHGFLDVHPNRIGKSVGGVMVLSSGDLPGFSEAAPVQLSAVGRSGRREKVAGILENAGYVRGENYFCVA